MKRKKRLALRSLNPGLMINKVLTYCLALIVLSCTTDTTEEVVETELPEPTSSDRLFQTTSQLGDSLFTPVYSGTKLVRLDSNLQVAYQNWQKDSSEINTVWYGRRMAYLGRVKEAIEIYTFGLRKYPESYKLYRHRGHRYITLRQFDKAVEDLIKASDMMPKDIIEIEPDGIPNRENTPLSSTQFNVWYHLGLAYYLSGHFLSAKKAYEECLKVSVNDDLQVATIDWLYMTLRRLGQNAQAEKLLKGIHSKMTIIENDAYFRRLMMYKGKLSASSVLDVSEDNADVDPVLATQGYGVGNWYLYNGDTTRAAEVFQQVVDGNYWSAFGFIAAENDLARLLTN